MNVNFQVLESQLTEVEMALLTCINVTMNAALLAGADGATMINHLTQHEQNFEQLGQKKAGHILAAMKLLTQNAIGR